MSQRLLAALLLAVAASVQAADDSILTATERGMAIEAGRDLATYIARPAGMLLNVLPTGGSTDNVQRLPAHRACAWRSCRPTSTAPCWNRRPPATKPPCGSPSRCGW